MQWVLGVCLHIKHIPQKYIFYWTIDAIEDKKKPNKITCPALLAISAIELCITVIPVWNVSRGGPGLPVTDVYLAPNHTDTSANRKMPTV